MGLHTVLAPGSNTMPVDLSSALQEERLCGYAKMKTKGLKYINVRDTMATCFEAMFQGLVLFCLVT